MHDADDKVLAEAIDAALPQTQCRRCGYDGCKPYAEAIATGTAINRCPPGGDDTIALLARITGRAVMALDASTGTAGPLLRAIIDEHVCIGCTLCIDACPVDAIAGGPKRMHTVVAALCTGCELCIDPCPVDCISLVPAGRRWTMPDAHQARERHAAWRARPRKNAMRNENRESATRVLSASERQDAVRAALERARARRSGQA